MSKTQLSKEMIQNIKNYGNEIVTIKDFVSGVRQNIGMWIGSRGKKGHMNMIREIVQNSLDEILKDSSPCTVVIVTYDESSGIIIVEDNGRGIPFGSMERVFMDPNTSSNYNKKKGEYSSGLHGCGAKVTNALSEFFYVDSYVLGEGRRIEFKDGVPWKKGEKTIPNKNNKQGTIITFKPSEEALELHKSEPVKIEDVYNLIKLILPLNKIGATVVFNGVRNNKVILNDTIVNEDGIMTYLIRECDNPIISPVFITTDTGTMKIDAAFTYDMSNLTTEKVISFCNTCPTAKGDHINGFLKGICRFFTKYMNSIYLANSRSKLVITPSDIKTGLVSVVSAFHLNPTFNGQAKEILEVPEMDKFINDAIYNGLEEWIKKNPNDLNRLCKFFKDIGEARVKADNDKIKISKNYVSSAFSKDPAKYVKPTGKKDLELWICEGDSAAGIMRNNRDTIHQGYFPIRGKIPNAMATKKSVFLANQEISGIIALIGAGYGKDFDPTKVRFKKIVLATDADADGEHICSLFIRFFIMYLPGLIENGFVYKAVPPLYGLPLGKGKTKYFKYRIDYIKYIQSEFSKTNTVEYADGKPMKKDDLSLILYNNVDYVYEVERIANRYSVDPLLLESVIVLRDLDNSKLKKQLKKIFRFIDIKVNNGITTIEGPYNNKYQTLFLNDDLIKDCKDILYIMGKNKDLAYKLNGKVVSIYTMMKEFDKKSPKNIERYKGLGEMSGKKLFESTMDQYTRSLVQYTMDDWKKELDTIKYYESNKFELLSGVQLTRFDIIN